MVPARIPSTASVRCPLQAQELAITSRLDLTKFKSASFVEQFTRRYLVAAGAAAASSGGTGSGLLV